jgi:multiple sugar transport system ATP-binding protein
MSSLKVSGLSKRFGQIQALKDVSFDVNDGEFMVVLGPTAAGKTTTLRCVAGLEQLDSGTILMDGKDVAGTSPAERDVAFVFQTYALYPRKTVYQNMAFPLEAREMSAKDIDNRVREVAALLQITELLDRRPANMSGGQQQRVALGRAMVRQPRMFLMDEPLTNLDFKLRVEMRAELKRLQRELAITFFYVTNDQVEAMTMADRVAVLNEGVLQQIDTPENIYDHPANLFVAQFVGNPRMNAIPSRFDIGERLMVAEDESWTVSPTNAQLDILSNVPNPNKLMFGVRGEDVLLNPQGDNMQGNIFILEPLGDRTFVDIEMGSYIVKARADADFQADSGDAIQFKFDTERTHVFDATTQETIY